MIRRDPAAIITAQTMDPERRQLFVEGPRDRLFLSWVIAEQKHPDAVILEIDSVNMPYTSTGGKRGRLVAFAQFLDDYQMPIRCFADADFDRLLTRSTPDSLWLTDGRDLEGYVVRVECLDKVLRLGLATEILNSEELLEVVRLHGRPLGVLRVLSETAALSLPFQKTELRKFLKLVNGRINFRIESYLRALFQNAGIGLTLLPQVKEELRQLEEELRHVPDSQLIHGKDAFCIIEKALSRFGIKTGEGAKLLWTSFEHRFVTVGSTLDEVATFLSSSSVQDGQQSA